MLIRTLHIRNFRSCEDVELQVDDLTAIVGANGCGKSAVLQALDLFYAVNPRFSADDFYANDTSTDVEIAVTFGGLSQSERGRFRRYVERETLTVTRILTIRDGRSDSSLHGKPLRFEGFAGVRNKKSASDAKAVYAALPQVESGELPHWTNRTAALTELDNWEDAHPESCERIRDEGSFFGFKEVAQGYLGRSTRLIFVPAVRDAADAAEDGKGSPINELVDLVIRQSVADNPDFRELVQHTQQRYAEVFDPDKFTELERISGRLTDTLRTYVPASEVQVTLDTDSVSLPIPRAVVRLSEDGFSTSVARCGHGLQRAFILTLLQQLAAARAEPTAHSGATGEAGNQQDSEKSLEPNPDLLLLIEEPELFQHPSRQRHFAEILKRLSSESMPGVARRVQVIYCTHSPHFVGLDRFENIRLFRKKNRDGGRPKVSFVYRAGFDEIAEWIRLAVADEGTQITGPQFKARLGALINPRTSEGFFAKVVVLVEGESDRAALIGTARSLGLRLEAQGVAIIPCSGKSNILNLAAVYKAFDIATYCVWDGDAEASPSAGVCAACGHRLDKKSDPVDNVRLLRLHGAEAVDFPQLQVTDTFACFETDLEKTICAEVGEEAFNEALEKAKREFGMSKRSHAMKNPVLLTEVIGALRSDEHVAPSLESIIRRIVQLAEPSGGGDVAAETPALEVPAHVPEVQGRGIDDATAECDAERP